MSVYLPEKSTKKRSGAVLSPPKEPDPTILRQIGNVGLAGLHTAGSILSLPSRAIYGSLNEATGGPGGFGNLDPFDMTGGVQASDFLANQGVISKNDPTAWEWMDPVRGAIDIAGDPTTFLGGLGLTKAGMAATKAGGTGLAKTITQQVKSGQRGLLSFGVPFGPTLGAIGTGRTAAKVALRMEKAGRAIGRSAPIRLAAQHFDSRVKGQYQAENQVKNRVLTRQQDESLYNIRKKIFGLARDLHEAKISGDDVRAIGEGTYDWTANPKGIDPKWGQAIQEYKDWRNQIIQEGELTGTIKKGQLDDVVDYMSRFQRPDVTEAINLGRQRIHEATRSKKSFRAIDPEDAGRLWYLKGSTRGTQGISDVLMDPEINDYLAKNITTIQTANGPKTVSTLTQRQAVKEVAAKIAKNHGSHLAKDYVRTNKAGKQIVQDRYKKLAQLLVHTPELRAQGLWGNHPLFDELSYLTNASDRILAGKAFYDQIAKADISPPQMIGKARAVQRPATDFERTVTVRQALKDRGFGGDRLDKAAREIWARKNPNAVFPPGEKWATERNTLLNSTIPSEFYNRVIQEGALAPNGKRSWYDSVNALFKASVLSRPARVVRDHISAVIQNMQKGDFSPWSYADAHRVVRGFPAANIDKLVQNPEIAQHLAERGIDPKDQVAATRGIMEMFAAARTSMNPMASELLTQGPGNQMVGGIEPFLREMPGALQTPQGPLEYAAGGLHDFARRTFGYAPDATGDWKFSWSNLNPAKVAGVGDQKTTQFGPAKAYEAPLEVADTMNRLQPWLHRMARGERSTDAMRAVNAAQVNYDPKTFTPTEQQIRRLLPFYSFFSRQLPFLATELIKRPGGGHGTTIKAMAAAGEEDPTAPAHIASTASIPLPTNMEDGSKQYLTGLGLMMEDPLQFTNVLKGDIPDVSRELFSRMAPIPKTLAELASGESFFQQGFSGGRELDQMDPGVGRLANNLAVMTGLRDKESPVIRPLGPTGELIAGNSPLAGPLSIGRQLTDTRTGALTKATNILSGAKVATVSPAAQQAAIREKAQILAKEFGAKQYAKVYFPPEVLDTLRKSDPVRAAQADAINALLKQLAAGARQRAAEKRPRKGSKT